MITLLLEQCQEQSFRVRGPRWLSKVSTVPRSGVGASPCRLSALLRTGGVDPTWMDVTLGLKGVRK